MRASEEVVECHSCVRACARRRGGGPKTSAKSKTLCCHVSARGASCSHTAVFARGRTRRDGGVPPLPAQSRCCAHARQSTPRPRACCCSACCCVCCQQPGVVRESAELPTGPLSPLETRPSLSRQCPSARTSRAWPAMAAASWRPALPQGRQLAPPRASGWVYLKSRLQTQKKGGCWGGCWGGRGEQAGSRLASWRGASLWWCRWCFACVTSGSCPWHTCACAALSDWFDWLSGSSPSSTPPPSPPTGAAGGHHQRAVCAPRG